ncbi:MAG: amidase domain-containing protein [Anaerolineaceae bacterium]
MVVSDTGTVEIYEFVNLTGSPKLKVAADYPIYKAALLAKQGTNDIEVSILLDAYAKEILDGVQQSIDEGEFTFTIINKHVMVFDPITWTLKTDGFTSRAKDDPGTDEVNWVDGEFIKREPEFEQMVEYEIHHTPIETFAQEILQIQTEIAYNRKNQLSGMITDTDYSGTAAASYIRTWVRVNNLNCPGGDIKDPVWQDYSAYNLSQYPTRYDCLDCTNYASQAMYYGGLHQELGWFPDSASWVNVKTNYYWLINTGKAVVTSQPYLSLGDLGIAPYTHTAMVSALNPLRYSSHTNDRLNYPWQSVLSTCVDVIGN